MAINAHDELAVNGLQKMRRTMLTCSAKSDSVYHLMDIQTEPIGKAFKQIAYKMCELTSNRIEYHLYYAPECICIGTEHGYT